MDLAAETTRLLTFAEAARVPDGFGYLDDHGRVDPSKPLELYINARMTHVFSLGKLLGHPGAAELAEHGVARAARLARGPRPGRVRARVHGARRLQRDDRGDPRRARAARGRHGHAPARLLDRGGGRGPGGARGRRLPRRQREHAHGRGVPGGVRRHGRRGVDGAGAAHRHAADRRARARARLAAARALRRGLAARTWSTTATAPTTSSGRTASRPATRSSGRGC